MRNLDDRIAWRRTDEPTTRAAFCDYSSRNTATGLSREARQATRFWDSTGIGARAAFACHRPMGDPCPPADLSRCGYQVFGFLGGQRVS
jgi:hypothetical protein